MAWPTSARVTSTACSLMLLERGAKSGNRQRHRDLYRIAHGESRNMLGSLEQRVTNID